MSTAAGLAIQLLITPSMAAEAMTSYRIETAGCSIEMQIHPSKRYAGTPVFFYPEERQSERLCLSEGGDLARNGCLTNFVGAASVVRFYAKSRNGQPCSTMREQVRLIDQNLTLGSLKPFEHRIPIEHGRASDIQLFGFEAGVLANRRSNEAPWRLFRQELFLDDAKDPFLIVHWKHTLTSIGVLDVIPVGSTDLR